MNNTLKSTLKMILIMIISGGLGATLYSVMSNLSISSRITIQELANFFNILVFIVLAIQLGIMFYLLRVKQIIKKDNYSDSENSKFDKYQTRLNLTQGLSTTITVFLIPCMLAISSSISFLAFFLIVLVNLINEVTTINITGKVQPEKAVDWTKFSLNQDMYNKADEYERAKIGKVGAKIITHIHIIFVFAFITLLITGFFFDLSGFEFILLGTLWAIFNLIIVFNYNKD